MTKGKLDLSQNRFDDYLALYGEYLDNEIRWSEATSLLHPHYLHLHEIHIENNSESEIRGYKMKKYLAGFIKSLGDSSNYLEKVVFCHSYEEMSGLLPEECARQQFYAFELQNPGQFRSLDEIVAAITNHGEGGPGNEVPSLKRLKGRDGLAKVLKEVQLIQPYILKSLDPKNIDCDHRIRKVSGAKDVQDLLAYFQHVDCYQFSIYGYEVKPQYRSSHLDSIIFRSFLEHAFILHILKWNSGLRWAHEQISGRNKEVAGLMKRWKEAKEATEAVFDIVVNLFAKGIATTEDFFLPLPEDGLNESKGLFRKSWGHSVVSFPVGSTEDGISSSFKGFYGLVLKYQKQGYRDLGEFVRACGGDLYLKSAQSVNAQIRRYWENCIFNATKLMSRRIQPGQSGLDDVKGIGADQFLLAVLFGLYESEVKSSIDITVRYLGTNLPDGWNQELFVNETRIKDISADGFGDWKSGFWRWISQNPLGLEWSPSKCSDTSMYLYEFVHSGLLRIHEHIRDEHEFHVHSDLGEGTSLSINLFLERLSNLTRFLARGDLDYGGIKLQKILFELDYLPSDTTGSSFQMRPILHCDFSCQGRLDSRELSGGGTFTETLRLLRKKLNFRLNEYDHHDNQGLFYNEDIKENTCIIKIVMKS